MSFKIEMPHVGESVTEAVIEKWLKQPGDRVEKYEPIVEVVTDKVAMEVPAPASGDLTLIVAQEGETVQMGAVIAEMNAEGVIEAEITPTSPTASSNQSGPPTTSAPSQQTEKSLQSAPEGRPSGLRIANPNQVGSMITAANVGPTGGAFSDTSLGSSEVDSETPSTVQKTQRPEKTFARLSPAVRRLIEQHNLDPSEIDGTGIGGRITRADVLNVVENTGQAVSHEPVSAGQIQKPSAMRRMIADHMAKSFREIPHAWSAVEVDVTGLVDCRKANQDSALSQNGSKLTYLPFALAVTAGALRSNPLLNSSWQEDGVLLHEEINVGIAVAGKGGLVVPVVRNADSKSILALSGELNGLVENARSGKLSLDDVSRGTFTLNNTGALGSVWGGAIINHPQAAILTTEAIVKRPVVINESVEIRSMMNICLSFDHRVIDGVEASAFLQDVKQGLEAITAETALE